MVALGFLAGVTERIRLGTAVIPLFNRDPLSLAKQAASVDAKAQTLYFLAEIARDKDDGQKNRDFVAQLRTLAPARN